MKEWLVWQAVRQFEHSHSHSHLHSMSLKALRLFADVSRKIKKERGFQQSNLSRMKCSDVAWCCERRAESSEGGGRVGIAAATLPAATSSFKVSVLRNEQQKKERKLTCTRYQTMWALKRKTKLGISLIVLRDNELAVAGDADVDADDRLFVVAPFQLTT